jgi:hypothetical protein
VHPRAGQFEGHIPDQIAGGQVRNPKESEERPVEMTSPTSPTDRMLYPVIIPVGWSLIGPSSERSPLPDARGMSFHRVRAVGALLASEDPAGRSRLEAMMLRGVRDFGRMDQKCLDAYGQVLLEQEKPYSPRLTEKSLLGLVFGAEPAAKIVIARRDPREERASIQYLLRDADGQCWQLNYVVRSENLPSWRTWLAEIERPDASKGDA